MRIKSGNAIGIITCMASTAGYVINDMFIKLASDTLPTGEIILIRALFAFLFIGFIVIYRQGFTAFLYLKHGALRIRVACEVFGTLMYLIALFNMPIGNAAAVFQVIPLVVTVGGAVFFREHVGWRRWTAIFIGFCGVMLIIRPGFQGFDVWSLLALAAAICIATRDLVTRLVPTNIPTLSVAWLTTISVGLLGLLLTFFEDWQPVELKSLVYLAAAAGFILCGYTFIVVAVRRANLAVIAPFHYSTIVWALLVGYLVWDEIPDIPTTIGIIILVSTGLYTFLRERKLGQRNY